MCLGAKAGPRRGLAEVEAAEDLAAETRIEPRGRLRVNAPMTFGVHALAPRLPEYLKAFPEISIELRLSNRFVDVTDEGYDVVFRVGELANSGLIARALEPYRLILCAAPSYLAARGAPQIQWTLNSTTASALHSARWNPAGISTGRMAA